MKKTTITMLCLAACFAAADTRITWLADVTADRAETVTGAQSGQVANAAAHIVRADNPHGVTAAQIGALTAEQDLTALAALVAYAATGKVTRLDGGDYFMTLDHGTGTVWKIEGPYTHLMIRLEPDFIDTATQTRPAWTTHTFPVSDEWGEAKVYDAESFQYSFNKSDWSAAWFGVGDGTFPVTLYPESGTADGTATIYESAYYATNIAFRAASTTDISAAPAWQVYTNIASSVTITNDRERPVRIYGDGSATGTVSFAALREPLPVYVEASGFPGIVWSNAYTVGGGVWQTNAVNVFLIWQSGTNIFVNPVTARPL